MRLMVNLLGGRHIDGRLLNFNNKNNCYIVKDILKIDTLSKKF